LKWRFQAPVKRFPGKLRVVEQGTTPGTADNIQIPSNPHNESVQIAPKSNVGSQVEPNFDEDIVLHSPFRQQHHVIASKLMQHHGNQEVIDVSLIDLVDSDEDLSLLAAPIWTKSQEDFDQTQQTLQGKREEQLGGNESPPPNCHSPDLQGGPTSARKPSSTSSAAPDSSSQQQQPLGIRKDLTMESAKMDENVFEPQPSTSTLGKVTELKCHFNEGLC